ncbi:hypothetical protein LTR36_001467 [Oleoguttula mirabilis]|uniref:Uncharacterized protein n=1 Tax=Oleoguttula mirabilis TaxID=1507867 RepID=A0AAV9J3E3_9PEZI|nr:hypothetical protein LTR36_001467 [Oleoguttula mirabilis]
MRSKVTESTGKDPVSVLPQSVQDSINGMNQKNVQDAPVESEAVASKSLEPTESDATMPQQTAVGEAVEVPAEADHARDITDHVPEQVLTSQKQAHVDPEASASPVMVHEKSAMESEFMSKVPESEATGESAATDSVPQQVVTSQKEAQVDPEASASPVMVHEKSAMESELMSKVPESEATGEPAPTASAALLSTAPLATSSAIPLESTSAAPFETRSAAPSALTSGAPQLGDPVSGVAPLSMDDQPVSGSKELNAPAGAPALPPIPASAETAAAPLSPPQVSDSRDVSPMSKPMSGGSTQTQPIVTTGVESSKAPVQSTPAAAAATTAAAGKPVGTPRKPAGGDAGTPQKRQSFVDRMKGTPDSHKSSGSDGSKRRSFFGRIKDKLK